MADEFNRVSLGFAEFVSQLLHETFDAVLGAQNYQMERYADLEKALGLSDESFAQQYLTADETNAKTAEALALLVADRKNRLRQLLNGSQMVKLMVDSGEIRAKLELSNYYESKGAEPAVADTTKSLRMKTSVGEKASPNTALKLKAREIFDPVTKQKTLLIDKSALLEHASLSTAIPRVRLVATPASATTSSNVFSEVIIKFKTV